jgi:hypothetical protein
VARAGKRIFFRRHKEATKEGYVLRLEREVRESRTTDKARAREKFLGALLWREGYSSEFREEVIALVPSKETDMLFDAAFCLLVNTDYKCSVIRLSTSQVLEDIRLLHDILPNTSHEEIWHYLKCAPEMLCRGDDEKKSTSALLLARMCNVLGMKAIESVWHVYSEISVLKNSTDDPGTKAAATVFMEKIESRIIEIGRDLESVPRRPSEKR